MFKFDDLLLATGAASAAAAALVVVQLLKAALPGIFEKITGGTMAFFITAAIYVAGTVVLWSNHTLTDANGFLGMFLAWLTAATAALGLHNVANNGAATFVQGAAKDNPKVSK